MVLAVAAVLAVENKSPSSSSSLNNPRVRLPFTESVGFSDAVIELEGERGRDRRRGKEGEREREREGEKERRRKRGREGEEGE